MTEVQRCSRCGQDKERADFYKSTWAKSGQWCVACYRAWHRARYTPRTGADDTQRQCATCGAGYTPRQRRPSAYCSRNCKEQARNAVQRQALLQAKLADRVCPTCGTVLNPAKRSDARFCSTRCMERAHNATRKMERRAGNLKRRRGLVSLSELAERDGWRCGICGGRIDRSRSHPDPLSLSVDHIVPVALGGDNDDSNLQAAHLRCNLAKGHRT